jgi:hypothetical protein
MVAASGDRWQADPVRYVVLAPVLVALAAASAQAGPLTGVNGSGRAVAQAPIGSPGAPRVVTFSWTLYPRMWAEVDLRIAAGAEVVAEFAAEGGEVSWNVHSHPVETSPAIFVVVAEGAASRATVPCTPVSPGVYSYLFGNDRNAGPVRLSIELRLKGDVRLEGVKP